MESLLDWTDKENRLRSVFGNDVIKARDFLRSKRDFFNQLHNSYKANATSEESVLLNVIRGERRKVDKLIYPSRTVRFIVAIATRIKAGIRAYRENRSLKDEMLSLHLKKSVGYSKKQDGKGTNTKNELHESAKETSNTHKKKGVKATSQGVKEQRTQRSDDSLLSKKRINNNSGRSIY